MNLKPIDLKHAHTPYNCAEEGMLLTMAHIFANESQLLFSVLFSGTLFSGEIEAGHSYFLL